MNYAKMLKAHKKSGADCTIAVIDVPIEEASRFGIMSTNTDNSIYKFEEKPKNPTSTKASMGIYIFTKSKLEKYLDEDAKDPESSNDFGKNIIPNMLAAGEKMYAYPFCGYWKDVGTISSLWEANMDLIGETPALDLGEESWRIFSRHGSIAPQYIGDGATIINSNLTEGCEIYGTVENSVLGSGVIVKAGAYVKDSVIMSGTVIESGAQVKYSIIGSDVTVCEDATVGADRSETDKIALIGEGFTIGRGECVRPGDMIG
jgi:glucose-1-phosphate adenylyltransferase